MRSVTARLIAAAAIICLPSSALAQVFQENFDSYTLGTVLDNVGGWFGFDNVPAVAGVVTDVQARSAPHSVDIRASTHAVHPFSGIDSGQWTMSAYQYIPLSPSQIGETHFILNNVFNFGGPFESTAEMSFDMFTREVTDALRPHTPLPIAFNEWVEIRLEIDLDNNTMDTFYNGALLSSGIYAVGGGPTEIANVDLFTQGPIGFYDDMSLVEPDSGQWTMSAYQYIPLSPSQIGETHFILNNVFNFGGPFESTAEMSFDMFTREVTDALRPHTPLPIAFNEWVEIRLEIDLDNNTMDTFYNGALLSSGIYAVGGGPTEIANVDLFTQGPIGFYDDMSLVPEPTTGLLLVLGAGLLMLRRRLA